MGAVFATPLISDVHGETEFEVEGTDLADIFFLAAELADAGAFEDALVAFPLEDGKGAEADAALLAEVFFEHSQEGVLPVAAVAGEGEVGGLPALLVDAAPGGQPSLASHLLYAKVLILQNKGSLIDEDVLELPGVLEVEVLLRQFVAEVFERVPVGVVASHWLDVGPLHLKAPPEVDLVALYQSRLGVLDRPDHACQNSRADLQRCRILVLHQLAGVFDAQLRPVPVGIFTVTVEEHAQLINALSYLLLDYLPLFGNYPAPDSLERRNDCILAGVIGVVAGRPVDHLVSLSNSEKVANGDGLIVGDEEAILRAKGGAPGFDLNIHAWLGHVDGALAAFPVTMGVGGFPFLVGPPAQLGGLVVALGNEAVNGPGVPELPLGPPGRSGLGISLCDVNALDSEVHHQESPLLLGFGL